VRAAHPGCPETLDWTRTDSRDGTKASADLRIDRSSALAIVLALTRRIGQHACVAKAAGGNAGPDDGALLALFGAITSRDHRDLARRLDSSPDLVSRPIRFGASRQGPDGYFLVAIRHHVYAGDTALHVAAAAHQRGTAELLVGKGAIVRARNRRGAEPLHYAADGSPRADYSDPEAQGDLVVFLIEAGADPNALDNSGVAPLHRAVRTRASEAVSALIKNGADPRLRNKSGSTPLHLAVQNTGRSDSGSDAAKEGQGRIIALLLERGASATDTDANGKTVSAAASSDWIRNLLNSP
jgi:ankyrin repeat protein